MSPSVLETAESQWLAQLTSMREALAELKLPSTNNTAPVVQYGQDILLDDDDDFALSTDSDDVWDAALGDINAADAHLLDGPWESPSKVHDQGHGQDWLRSKCDDFALRHPGVAATDLQEQIVAVLSSDDDGSRACFHPRDGTDQRIRERAPVEPDRHAWLRRFRSHNRSHRPSTGYRAKRHVL